MSIADGILDASALNDLGAALKILAKPMRTVIPFGDSITVGSSTFISGVWRFGGSWVELACYGAGLQIIRNAGKTGDTVSQMAARIQADVIDYAPDVVPLGGLTNDMPGMSSNASYATALDIYEGMAVKLIRAGILPVIVVPPPYDAYPVAARNVRAHLYRLAAYYNLPLIDLYQVAADPSTGGLPVGV